MRLALALMLAACSTSPARPRGTANVETSDPTLPAQFAASATATESTSGLTIVISNLLVASDACEPARVLAQNATDSEADVAVFTVTVGGAQVASGTYTDATGATGSFHRATDQCTPSDDETAASVFVVIQRSGDSISGSVKLGLSEGPTFAVFDAALCQVSDVDAGAFCTHYPPCVEDSVGACIETP